MSMTTLSKIFYSAVLCAAVSAHWINVMPGNMTKVVGNSKGHLIGIGTDRYIYENYGGKVWMKHANPCCIKDLKVVTGPHTNEVLLGLGRDLRAYAYTEKEGHWWKVARGYMTQVSYYYGKLFGVGRDRRLYFKNLPSTSKYWQRVKGSCCIKRISDIDTYFRIKTNADGTTYEESNAYMYALDSKGRLVKYSVRGFAETIATPLGLDEHTNLLKKTTIKWEPIDTDLAKFKSIEVHGEYVYGVGSDYGIYRVNKHGGKWSPWSSLWSIEAYPQPGLFFAETTRKFKSISFHHHTLYAVGIDSKVYKWSQDIQTDIKICLISDENTNDESIVKFRKK